MSRSETSVEMKRYTNWMLRSVNGHWRCSLISGWSRSCRRASPRWRCHCVSASQPDSVFSEWHKRNPHDNSFHRGGSEWVCLGHTLCGFFGCVWQHWSEDKLRVSAAPLCRLWQTHKHPRLVRRRCLCDTTRRDARDGAKPCDSRALSSSLPVVEICVTWRDVTFHRSPSGMIDSCGSRVVPGAPGGHADVFAVVLRLIGVRMFGLILPRSLLVKFCSKYHSIQCELYKGLDVAWWVNRRREWASLSPYQKGETLDEK